jgi:rod shape-determining protein MreD
MMPRGQQLLLPARTSFIWFSLWVGMMVNFLQNIGFWGNAAWAPDVFLLVLIFWCIHQPLRVGMGWCFVLGLVSDVHQTALLGQHALSFSVMGFLALQMHRRLMWFTGSSQAPQVLPVFACGTLLDVGVRYIAGRDLPGWSVAFSPVIEALLWAPVSFLLLMPQRRAPDPDENRPL